VVLYRKEEEEEFFDSMHARRMKKLRRLKKTAER
jgi:hypothetical protein